MLTLYFGRGAVRASRGLETERQRPKPWNNSSSAEQAYRLRELDLRRAFRRRVLGAAVSGAAVLLSVLVRTTVTPPVPHAATTSAQERLKNMTSEDLGISIFLTWLLIAAAGLFLFFAARCLFLTAIAQRHRTLERRLIVRGVFRLSSYDEQGRSLLRRAGTAGLFSLVGVGAVYLVAATLHYVQ